MSWTCPACGYPSLTDPPRSKGGGGSYEICPSCGFQFGVTDDDLGYDYRQWRAKWIAGGMIWDKGYSAPPIGWDPVEQVHDVIDEGDDERER